MSTPLRTKSSQRFSCSTSTHSTPPSRPPFQPLPGVVDPLLSKPSQIHRPHAGPPPTALYSLPLPFLPADSTRLVSTGLIPAAPFSPSSRHPQLALKTRRYVKGLGVGVRGGGGSQWYAFSMGRGRGEMRCRRRGRSGRKELWRACMTLRMRWWLGVQSAPGRWSGGGRGCWRCWGAPGACEVWEKISLEVYFSEALLDVLRLFEWVRLLERGL